MTGVSDGCEHQDAPQPEHDRRYGGEKVDDAAEERGEPRGA